ncbi:hypothetical protein [Selenomonas ruminantium]|uniref:hypothetical protein n=1 Tax=Selenomonas ruminantium TaxID=971 RepID=UPI0026F0B031|nr:hypothetical protein [Selenomonas ruminantium]
MKTNCIIGIDPGASGGIAIYIPGQLVRVVKMPKDPADFRDLLGYYKENYTPLVFMEKLTVRPDDIAVQAGAANMGKLYRIQKMIANFEHMKALMEADGIPFVLVHPQSWQTRLKLRTRGEHEEKDVRKRRYQAYAASQYPSVRVTLWNADALLIMHFGRWALVNDLQWVKSNLPTKEHDKIF